MLILYRVNVLYIMRNISNRKAKEFYICSECKGTIFFLHTFDFTNYLRFTMYRTFLLYASFLSIEFLKYFILSVILLLYVLRPAPGILWFYKYEKN